MTLRKSLYGLKHAPRTGNNLLTSTLVEDIGCECVIVDQLVLKCRSGPSIAIALCGLRIYEKTEAASRKRLGGGEAGGAHHNDAEWKVILHVGVSRESTPLPPSY